MKRKDKSRDLDYDPIERKKKLNEKKSKEKSKKKPSGWQDWLEDDEFI
jgi:hypothetical protein